MAKGSVSKKIAVGAVVVIVLLIVLVAITPMLITAGLGHGLVRGAIEDQLAPGSRAEIQRLNVRWRGPQELHGLRIIDPAGQEVANVNMSVSPGLWSLLFGTVAVLEANVYATVNAEFYDDGTTNLTEILAPQPERPDERPQPMAGVPRTLVNVGGITVNGVYISRETGERQPLVMRDLQGSLTYDPADQATASNVRVDLSGQTEGDGIQGTVRLAGEASNLFDRDGYFTPDGAPMNFELALGPAPLLGVAGRLAQLTMLLSAENMAQLVSVDARAEAQIEEEQPPQGEAAQPQPSRFRMEAGVRVPFTPDGRLDTRMENIAGTVSGERVPSSLVQPFVANTPIVLARDVGPTVDLHADLSPALDGQATVRITGALAQLEMTARQDDGWWRGDWLLLRTPQAHPALVEGFTGLLTDRAANVEIEMTSFAFPPADPALEARPLARYAGTGVIRINEPVGLLFQRADDPDAPARPILVEQGQLEFDSPALGEYLELAGQMQIEGGQARLQHRITNLFDEDGTMNVFAADIVGELEVENLPSQTLAMWMPEQEEMIREFLGERVSMSLVTTTIADGLQADIVAQGQEVNANVTALRRPDSLEITQTFADFTLTPALMAYFQQGQEDPIVLLERTPARVELDTLVLQGTDPTVYRLRDASLGGRLVVNAMPVEGVPGVTEPVSLQDVNASFRAALARDPFDDEPVDPDAPLFERFGLEGSAVLARYANGDVVSNLTIDVTGTPGADAMEFTGSLAMSDLDVRNVELLMGREPGLFELWVGQTGSLTTQFSGIGNRYEATLIPDMPRVQGTFAATYENEIITLNSEDASLNLAAQALERLLALDDPDAAIDVQQDVPLTIAVNARMPLAFLMFGPIEDPTQIDIRAEMRGGPVPMVAAGQREVLETVFMELAARGFSDALEITFVLEGGEQERAEAPPATGPDLRVRGSVHETVARGQPITFEHARLNMDASLQRVPTAIADAFMGMRSYLTAAVGPHIDGTITAQDFTRTSDNGGTLAVDLRSQHGWLRGSGVGRDAMLWILLDQAVEGELEITPILRDALLSHLNPLLGEVLHAEQPLRITFAPASLPLDGDVSKLSGTLRLTIGDVQLDRRSPLFAILAMADVREAGFAAHIEPIEIEIRDGVIEYDRFNVQIDRFTMPYSGRINLVTGEVRLRTALPLSALRIRELDRIAAQAGDIEIPLVTRGRMGEPLVMQLDPEFDVAQLLLRYGIERGLRDLLPRR